ncbi:MAG: hypothetical protein R3C53_24905 [Pirellulaceae bacterium]
MSNDALLKNDEKVTDASASDVSAEWSETFLKHLGLEFTAIHAQEDQNDDQESLRQSMTLAFVTTLADSGASKDELVQLLKSQSRRLVPVETGPWTNERNRRRVELIDKSIESKLLPAEELELAQLTEQLRAKYDTEELVPLAGIRALREKLIDTERESGNRS